MQLIYFADPMCSWCWGFAPVIASVAETFGETLPIRLVLGGLRPGTTEPMTDEARETLRGHWEDVTEASGQPFGEDALSKSGFVYDTDPAARAVVLVRRAAPERALAFLERVQRAFYLEAKDVTSAGVLADLAGPFGLSRASFLADMASEGARQETWRDYAVSQRAGVRGFPTLILGPRADGVYEPISRGFATASTVLARIAAATQTVAANQG